MPLTPAQKQVVVDLDHKAKQILDHQGGDEALLMSLRHEMDKIKNIMDTCTEEELDRACEDYLGFYQYMKLLERLASGLSQGIIAVPTNSDLKLAQA